MIDTKHITLYEDAITHAVKNIKLFLKVTGTIDGRNEFERCRFVDVILSSIVSTLDKKDNVKLHLELIIIGPYGKGRADFTIKCNDTIICVTEAKRSELEYGFCQNLIQLQSACKVNYIFFLLIFLHVLYITLTKFEFLIIFWNINFLLILYRKIFAKEKEMIMPPTLNMFMVLFLPETNGTIH